MKSIHVFLAIVFVLSLGQPISAISWNSIKKSASSAAGTVKDKTSSAADAISGAAGNIKNSAQSAFQSLTAITDKMVQNFNNIMSSRPSPTFCTQSPLQAYAPTIKNPDVISQDTEGMIPIIEKYTPVFYLCNETYLPIAVEDYFTAPGTRMVYQPSHEKNSNNQKQIVIPAGQMSMQKIYDQWIARGKRWDDDLFFEVEQCVLHGSNPKNFTDGQGNLTTPVYVTWFKNQGKIYITYVTNYGFNGPYTIEIPVVALPILKGDITKIQNAHEFDLEHITLELNEQTKQLERIFFGAHGSGEGVWLNATHKDISYENGHPVAYVANSGHGVYPRAGTHVRIYGLANDITCKSKRWIPQVVLLYPESDPRFDATTMGWMYHPGDYGKRGVSSFSAKAWFYNADAERRSGMPHDKVPFCPHPRGSSIKEKINHRFCLEKARLSASIPK